MRSLGLDKKEGEIMFSIDGKLWRFLSKMADLIIVNVIFIICSIPVITIGASKTALYEVARKIRRDEESSILKNFFSSFKKHFKKSTIIWLMYLLCMVMIGVNLYACIFIRMGLLTTIFMMATAMVLFVVNITFVYTIMLVVYEDENLKVSLLKGGGLAIANLPFSILMITMEIMPFILLFFYTHYWSYIFTFCVIIGFSLIEFVNSHLLDKILSRVEKYREIDVENNKDEEGIV